jgi:hypothetical protein
MEVRLVRCDTLRVVCCESREKREEREERVIEWQDRYLNEYDTCIPFNVILFSLASLLSFSLASYLDTIWYLLLHLSPTLSSPIKPQETVAYHSLHMLPAG